MAESDLTTCDHDDDLVAIFSDSVADVASIVEHGVLVEHTEDGINVYLEEVEEDCAAQLLQRALSFLQGS